MMKLFHARYSNLDTKITRRLSCREFSAHHTQGIESRSLLLLPSASCLDLSGELELELEAFPFTLCLISPASPLTTPLISPSNTSFSRKPLFLGVGV